MSLHHNLQIGGGDARDERFEAVRPGSKPHYTSVRFAAFGALPVGESSQLQGRVQGQYTDDALVPSEQFGIGGAATVRGYSERELAGDRGLITTLELVGPNMAEHLGITGDLRLSAFADAGTVHNRLGTPCRDTQERCSIASVGAGASLAAGRFGARVHVAHALRDAARTERGDLRGHFALSYAY
jgi:hemolysin activation/secretion protein